MGPADPAEAIDAWFESTSGGSSAAPAARSEGGIGATSKGGAFTRVAPPSPHPSESASKTTVQGERTAT